MPHSSSRRVRALVLILIAAVPGCKADRTSSGSVAFQQAPIRIGSLDTTLSLNGISFHVVGHERMATIQPSGLTKDNGRVDTRLPGLVAGAEIADLNGDTWPELLVYSVSPDSTRRMSVTAYSSNGNASMSQMDFDGMVEDPRLKPGYGGHDEFAIVNGTLMQRFPVHDPVGRPTGKTRQITYSLVNGEGSRLLRVEKIVDY